MASPLARGAVLVLLSALVPACGSGGNGGSTLTGGPPPGLVVVTASLPGGTNGSPYPTTALAAANGTGPYAFSLLSGSLPPGVTLTAGALSGTPTADGVFWFTVRVTDAKNAVADQLLSITVTAGTASALAILTSTPLAGATEGSSYSFGLSATGGLQPYTWTITAGSLPPGLTLSAATGVISGTPTGTSAGFTVKVTDSTSPPAQTATLVATLPVNLAMSLGGTLPSATLGAAYSHTPAVTNGTAPYAWTLVSGTLPTGLTLAANGLISGTPTVQGVTSFVLKVTDSAGATATAGFDILVNGALTFTTTSLAADTTGVTYGPVTLFASGGTTPYTNWAVTTGTLPAGIIINNLTGVLSGTPTASGTATLTFTVTDSAGATATSVSLSLVINAAPTLTGVTLPQDTQGIPYSQSIFADAAGGTPPLTFALSGGATLPAGLTLSNNGLISGTPAGASIGTFTIVVTDAENVSSAPATFQLTVNQTPSITNTPTTTADDVGHAYPAFLFKTAGGTGAVTLSVPPGTLPPGLSLVSGTLSGTPTTAGTYTFTVTATDTLNATGSESVTITINPGPTVSTTTLTGATQGVPYTAALNATGGTAPYTWSLATGSNPLPLGLSFSATGLTGTPSGSGTFTFTVQATDVDAVVSAPQALSLTITPSAPSIATTTLPDGASNSFYSFTLSGTGGVTPYSWAQQAGTTLPTGVSLAATGVLSGTPTTTGTFTLIVVLSDSSTPTAQKTAASTFTFKIVAPTAPQGSLTILTSRLPDAAAGTAYSNTLDATGGTAPYSFALDATGTQLPASLTLTAATGLISGTPAIADEGQYTFGVTVTDNSATKLVAHANVKLVIGPPPAALQISSTSLPSGRVDVAYPPAPLVATGGQPPYSWAFTGSSVVPFGMVLSKAGVLSGYPRQNGVFPVTIAVTDSSWPPTTVATLPMTLTIAAASSGFQITSATLPNGAIGAAYSQTLGANATATQWVTNPAILAEAGLTLNSVTGTLSSASPLAVSGVLNFPVAAVSNTAPPTGSAANISMTIPPAAFGVTTTVLPDFTLGQAYSPVTIMLQGGVGPFTWTVLQGPPGLTVSATGVLSGTPTGGGGGTNTLVVQVKDSGVNTTKAIVMLAEAPVSASLTSIAASAKSYDTALLAPLTLVRGTAAAAFVMGVQNTDPDVTSAGLLAGQSLPAGLVLSDPVRRQISGTPTIPGRYLPRFVLSEMAESQTGSGPVPQFSESQGLIEVQEPTGVFSVLTHTLPSGREGVAYPKSQIFTSGVTAGAQAFTVSSGTLPTGLVLDAAGFLSGTPTESGLFPVVVQIVNGANTIHAAYDLSIDPALPIGIATARLTSATLGVAYQDTLYVYGASGAVTWSDTGSATTLASLGLALGGSTGLVTGTPTAAAGLYSVQVTATSGGHTSVRPIAIQLLQTPVIAQYFAFPGVVGLGYSDSIQAFGGTAPYSFALVPGETLPPGITMSAAGVLSGTPTATVPFGGPLLAITDSTSGTPRTGFGQLLLIVLDAPAPSLGLPAGSDALSGQVGSAFSFTPAPVGGTAPYTLAQETTVPPASTSDALPPGVLLGAGSISGTPTESGIFIYTLKVTDSSASPLSIDAQLILTIEPSTTGLAIETVQLPTGSKTANYPNTQVLMSANGVAGPFTWSLSNVPAALSASLKISATGVVSSTAALPAGTYFFTVNVASGAKTGSGRVRLVIQ